MPCFPCLFRKNVASPVQRSVAVDEEVSGIHPNVRIFSYQDLRIATDGFSLANKIGQGGFGSVYKGRLAGGRLAAIKVLSAESRQGVREFLTEIDVISNVEHENLVKLHGCCIEGHRRILVYGYLENNSLAQTLLGGRRSSIQFSWKTRLKICIGVARGLAYLHEEVQPHIVHRDIKASNILLDKDLNPKIADFGLAKLLPPNMTHVSTRVAGTVGYLAPEYAIRGQLTRKADIYAFGILIMEIVSGRCNTNKMLPSEEQYLLERVPKDWSPMHPRNAKASAPMSTVLKMLMGEMEVDGEKITEPGFISDLMDVKVRDPKKKSKTKNTSDTASSGMSQQENSSVLSENTTTYASITFTAISDRSP